MTQVKKLDFSGITIFCGVDVHKKSWRVNIQDSDFELEDFTQNPDAVLLHKHLTKRYPGANYKIGYEAGFSGFGMQRILSQCGCDCWVVNAADIPASDKDKKQKQDKADARKLCAYLQSKKLKGIHIPAAEWEHARTLVRTRERIVNNQTRCKNRIWQLLHFSGLPVPAEQQEGKYWSKRFIDGLQKMDCGGSIHLQQSLQLHIKDYLQTRQLLLEATRAIRALCREEKYAGDIKLLRSIPGIGEINAAVMLFELQDACPGRNLTLLEMKSAMAMLFRNFSVTKSTFTKPVDEHFGFLMAPKNLSVTFQKRRRIDGRDIEQTDTLDECSVTSVGV